MREKTVKVQRANVILQISEDSVNRYLDQGYNVIDASGKVIKESVPNDIGALRKAYVEYKKKIDELQKIIEELTAQGTPQPAVDIQKKPSKNTKKQK